MAHTLGQVGSSNWILGWPGYRSRSLWAAIAAGASASVRNSQRELDTKPPARSWLVNFYIFIS